MVVAQLVEWLLPTPEICSSNPDIGEILSNNCTIEKTKIEKKRPGMAHLLEQLASVLQRKFDYLVICPVQQILNWMLSWLGCLQEQEPVKVSVRAAVVAQ